MLERRGDARAHGRDVRRELGRLRDHGAVDVADLPARRAHAARGLGQQHDGIGAAELRIGVGKVPADVAEPGRAEQRIGDRMQQHVGIRMAEQAGAVRHLDAAQDQLAARHQLVNVPALADADIESGHGCATRRLCRTASASAKSSG